VLVALARRRGPVVSRDDLIDCCWGGRTVGEDAINRCIAAIRKLSEAHGGFLITTVPRVGYRLDESAPPLARPAQPLLAVLAFDNLSGDADMAYFSDGVSEEILQTVASRADVKVIGRGSSFQFRGAEKSAMHVAARLNATHVLDGSVRRSGSRIRISAHLIECAGETTVWSDRFDRNMSDVFELQDEIAAAVATALRVTFAPTTRTAAVDPAAYDLYLAALRLRENMFLENPTTLVAATKLVEQSVALAPDFSRAWAFLARLRIARLRVGRVEDSPAEPSFPVLRARVIEAAEASLRLDPGSGYPLQILGDLEPFGAFVEREALHLKALSISPNDFRVLFSANVFSSEVGRTHEALGYVKQAYDLEPLYPPVANGYGCMLDSERRYEESLPLWDRFRSLWPRSEIIAWNAISSAANNEDWPRFEALVKSARQTGLYTPTVRSLVWFGKNLQSPDASSVRAALDGAREQIVRTGNAPLEMLTSLHRLGFHDEVFDLIDRCSFAYVFDAELGWAGGLTVATIFSGMHNTEMMRDPRFVGLCAKLGLRDYWLKSDRWPDCAEDGVLPYDFKAECRRHSAA